jgi:hypothetical protein
MGWVEMGEREPRPAEVVASVFAEQLTMTAASGLMGVIGGQRTSIRFPSSGRQRCLTHQMALSYDSKQIILNEPPLSV